MSAEEREPYSLAYAADLLKVSPAWLADRARKNEVPHVKLGRRRVFTKADIDRILAIHRAEVVTNLTPGSLRATRAARARRTA